MNVLRPAVFCVAMVFLSTVIPSHAEAAAAGRPDYGVRVGATFSGEDFQQYEVFGAFSLPWVKNFRDGWRLGSDVDLSAGVLHGAGDTGGKVAGAVDLLLFSPSRQFSMTAGFGAGLQSKEHFGDNDFGGPLYFLFQAGLSYWFTPSFSVGYRFHHESNGSIYDTNPSLNLHAIELRLTF